MARVSRRKTLSHSEIESFLSEITTNDSLTEPGKVETKTVPYDDFAANTGFITAVVDPMRTEVQLVRDFCKVDCNSFCYACFVRNYPFCSITINLGYIPQLSLWKGN